MTWNVGRKSKSRSWYLVLVLGALVLGVALGALLAAAVAPLLSGLCESAPACERPLFALIGGMALAQALHIGVMYALVDRLNRQSESRLLDHLARASSDEGRVEPVLPGG